MITETGGIRAGAFAPNVTEGPRQYREGELVASRYRLEHLERSSWLCDIWRATRTDLGPDVEVSLKILQAPHDCQDRAAFEARAIALGESVERLSHPNLERVLDVGTTDHGDPFLCCEHLEGETLDELLRREGRISEQAAAQLVLPVLEALQAAHDEAIVHGDLRLESILSVHAPHAAPSPRLRDLGVVVGGTHARPGDELFDIWGMSRIAERLVYGAEGVQGDSAFARIIARGVDPDPAQRWQSAHDLGKALAIWLVGHGVGEDCTGLSLYARWFWQRGPRSLVLTNEDETDTGIDVTVEDAVAPVSTAPPISTAPLAYDPALDAPIEVPRRRLGGWAALAGALAIVVFAGVAMRTVIKQVPDTAHFAQADRVLVTNEPRAGAPAEAPAVTPIEAPAPSVEELQESDGNAAPAATPTQAAAAPPRQAHALPPPTERPEPAHQRPSRSLAKSHTELTMPSAPTASPTVPPAITEQPDEAPALGGSAVEPAIPFHKPDKSHPEAPPPPPPAPPPAPPPPPATYDPSTL
jgi:hypothetical protein